MDINNRLISVLLEGKVFAKLGLAATRIIRKRTRSGKDVKGAAFKPYSENYARLKSKAGFANPRKVNLELSRVGSMLGNITYAQADNSVEVFFEDARAQTLAYYHNISGAGKSKVIRNFWGIQAPAELEQLTALAQKESQKIIAKEVGVILKELFENKK